MFPCPPACNIMLIMLVTLVTAGKRRKTTCTIINWIACPKERSLSYEEEHVGARCVPICSLIVMDIASTLVNQHLCSWTRRALLPV